MKADAFSVGSSCARPFDTRLNQHLGQAAFAAPRRSIDVGEGVQSRTAPVFAGTTDCAMPYTYTSLVFLWLVTLGLFAVSASGVLAGSWLMLLPLIALATPALILRRFTPAPTIAPQLAPARVIAAPRRRPKAPFTALD